MGFQQSGEWKSHFRNVNTLSHQEVGLSGQGDNICEFDLLEI